MNQFADLQPPHDDPTPQPGRGRVLVFIVAYQAETHLRGVLDRIPAELLDDPDVDLLVIDDASSDRGVHVAGDWARERGAERVIVLRNPVNQGYGGNQKLGYRFAVDGGYGLVILLHGDGQYAPELLPQFVATWRTTGADAILGSRMIDLQSAKAGGMPWYKQIGNRFLTRFQNKVTGRDLSEYHTGYRAYSVDFLRRVPFELNTNDFHFDTEILLQAFHVGAKVEEFPIPTYYGDEICRVNSVSYGLNVVAATLQWKLHQMGMLCSLKYRGPGHLRYADKTYMAYSSHRLAMSEIERLAPARVLDLGCGPGFVAERVAQLGAEVTGVDTHPPIRPGVAKFIPFNLEQPGLPVDAWDYDAILLLDVIEHLAEPERFLLDLRNGRDVRPAEPGQAAPTLILSTPNVAFAAVRLNLLLGRFTYADRGILDITHKRLFTRKTLLGALEDCGYAVERVHGSGAPFAAVVGGPVGNFLNTLSGWAAKVWPTMFAFQFVIRCRPRPGVRQLLAGAQRQYVADDRYLRVLEGKPERPLAGAGVATDFTD